VPNSRQRRDAERRRLQRQVQRRQQRARARRRMTTVTAVVAVVALIGLVVGILLATSGGSGKPAAQGQSSSHPTAPSTPPSSPTTPTTPGDCSFTKTGTAARPVQPPPSHAPTKGTVSAVVDTSQGAMTFTLDRHQAPCTVANFVSLAQQKYFNSTPCHRLTTGGGLYVLQCGDPTGTGSGGPGYQFPDELTGKEKYTRGVLAMANSGPNTNGSQFFIVYKNSQLPPSYTVFGSVTAGLSVVDKVAAKGVQGGGSDGKPALPVTIQKVTVKKAGAKP
jgi:peptidyl-prolyl cis-trans isomerase B (cyclophilin B)